MYFIVAREKIEKQSLSTWSTCALICMKIHTFLHKTRLLFTCGHTPAILQTIFSMQQLFHRSEAPTVTQTLMQSGTVASLRKSDTKV